MPQHFSLFHPGEPLGILVDSPSCPLHDLLGQAMKIHVGLVGVHKIARKSCQILRLELAALDLVLALVLCYFLLLLCW